MAVEAVTWLGAGPCTCSAPSWVSPRPPRSDSWWTTLLGGRGVRFQLGGAISGSSGFGRAPHPVDLWESWEERSELPFQFYPWSGLSGTSTTRGWKPGSQGKIWSVKCWSFVTLKRMKVSLVLPSRVTRLNIPAMHVSLLSVTNCCIIWSSWLIE